MANNDNEETNKSTFKDILGYLVKPQEVIKLAEHNKILAIIVILISNNLIIAIIVFFTFPRPNEFVNQIYEQIINKEETDKTNKQEIEESTDKYYDITPIPINMDRVCELLAQESPKFKEELFLGDNNNQDVKSKYNEHSNNTWPVFRWSCNVVQGGSNKVRSTGIDLNEYCSKAHRNTKAFYLHYKDQNSWHCVNVPGDHND